MKNLLFTLVFPFSIFLSSALAQQAPQKFNYQAIARDAAGKALTEQEVLLQITILSGDAADRPVYVEEHAVVTNKLGLFNLQIGTGEAVEGSMQSVDWGSASHYISVAMDAEGTGRFEEMGTSQLLSVPYALYAEKSGSANAADGRDDPNDWTINGNSGTDDAINFIGTLDENDLAVRTNDTEVARFKTTGDLDLAEDGRLTIDGQNALSFSGTENVLIGNEAGNSLTSGQRNMLVGWQSGYALTTGGSNTFLGYRTGYATTSGTGNAFIGSQAGQSNLGGSYNVFLGSNAGQNNTTGNNNLFLGLRAGQYSTTGLSNIAIGTNAGRNLSTSSDNAFIGREAGLNTTTGASNTFIGRSAGQTNATGSSNTYIGYQADGSADLTNATAIGSGSSVTQSNSVVLGNNANVGIGTSAPDAKLHVEGTLKLVDGTQADGYVLTSDADGNAGWVDPASLTTDTMDIIANDAQTGYVRIRDTANVDLIEFTVENTEIMRINPNGVGIGTLTPQADLEVSGTFRYEDGSQGDGKVLTSDADGDASWTSVSSLDIDAIADADNDTKVEVEKNTDEDIIRFKTGGTEYFTMENGRLEIGNTGYGVFIGNGAGENDDLSNNQNTFVGTNAGNATTTGDNCAAFGFGALKGQTTGTYNNAFGAFAMFNSSSGGNYNNAFGGGALQDNTTGDQNSAFGDLALYVNTTGSKNTAMGTEALGSTSTASNNTAVGYQAGKNATGGSGVFLGYQAGKSETGSNKLYIENSSSTSPLIYGEFDNNLVRVNGELDVEGNITTNYHWISNNGNDQGIYIGDNGYVGINTTDFTAPLNVNGDSDMGGGSSDYDGNSEYVSVRGRSEDWYLAVQNESSVSESDFFIGQSNTEDGIFHIQQDGNVGIGTNSPSAKLDVDGTLEIGGVLNTQSNWISGDGDDEGISVDADGNVGMGTTAPDVQMHVLGSYGTRIKAQNAGSNYAGFVAENNNGEFFIGLQGTGDPNSGEFHIYSNTAGARRMVITSAGNVGFGYNNPSYKLQVNGQVAGTSAYVNTSDAKYKTNVQPISSSLEKVMLLEGVSYDWKTKEFPEKNFDNRHQLGFIAQDVEAVLPEAVSITDDGDYGLSYSTFVPLLVEAVKELKKQNDHLNAENEALKATLMAEKVSNSERLTRLEEVMNLGVKAQR